MNDTNVSRVLLVAGSPEGVPATVLCSLADESDIVVAIDSGGDHCRRAGVAVSVLLGDLDSISGEGFAYCEACGAEVLRYPADKDVTDMQIALDLVRERGYGEAVVTCALGGRLDHELAVFGAMGTASDLRPRLVGVRSSIWVLQAASGDETSPAVRSRISSSEFGCAVGDEFSILALGGPACVRTEGMYWDLLDETLGPLDGRGVSNVVSRNDATVTVTEGCIFVVVTH